jgi:uncharacterized protein DUF3800
VTEDKPARKTFARYRLYIDESGDHTFNLLDDSARRYLALLGVWFRQGEEYTAFSDALEHMKRQFFGARPDNPVILHRSDIINRRRAFGVLCDEELRARFDAALIELVQRASFKMVCVVIDKKQHSERYKSPLHPYHYCLAALLDRYSGWLNFKNARGDVLAESRGKEEDIQLKEAYRRVYESGTLLFGHAHHQRALTSKEIKLDRKGANIAGLQLADLLAHPAKQAYLVEKGVVEDRQNVYGNRLFAAVRDKFNCVEPAGRVEGYGKVWL